MSNAFRSRELFCKVQKYLIGKNKLPYFTLHANLFICYNLAYCYHESQNSELVLNSRDERPYRIISNLACPQQARLKYITGLVQTYFFS